RFNRAVLDSDDGVSDRRILPRNERQPVRQQPLLWAQRGDRRLELTAWTATASAVRAAGNEVAALPAGWGPPVRGDRPMSEPPLVDPSVTATAWRPRGLFSSTGSSAAMGVYVPATLAIRLINFGRIILLTWFMTTQQFGLMNILLLVINVLTPFCSLGLT